MQVGQHLPGVLAEDRRAARVVVRLADIADRVGDAGHGSRRALRQVDPEPARLGLRVGENLVEVVDRPAGDADRFERGDPRVLRPGQHHLGERRDQRVAVLDPPGIGPETRVPGELGPPAGLAEPGELGVVADRDDDIVVGRLERLVGNHVGMRVAHPRRRLAGGEIVHRLVGGRRHRDVEQRHVDMLAFAGALTLAQGGQRRDRGVEPGQHVGDGDAHLLRAAARQVVALAGDRHQPAHRLDEEIVARAVGIGPGLAEAGDRAVDQPGIDRAQILVAEPVAGEPAALVVLQQDVGGRDQPADDLLSPGRGEVEGDRFLAPIGAVEIGRVGDLAAVLGDDEGRPPQAGVVAGAGALDLDHLGAEIGHRLGGPGAGQDAAEIEDPEAGKRPRHVYMPAMPT